MGTTTRLPMGWSLYHFSVANDGDFYTVYSPRQKHGGTLGCALSYGFIMSDNLDIEIPPAVMCALEKCALSIDRFY